MARAIDSEVAFRFLTEQLVKETGAFSKGVNKGLNIARSAIRNPDAIPTLTPPNEPLTIEQLRGMDGEPVWIVDIGDRNWYGPGWAIVDRENNLVRTVKNWNAVFFEKYGERWLAYCRPPERQEATQ